MFILMVMIFLAAHVASPSPPSPLDDISRGT